MSVYKIGSKVSAILTINGTRSYATGIVLELIPAPAYGYPMLRIAFDVVENLYVEAHSVERVCYYDSYELSLNESESVVKDPINVVSIKIRALKLAHSIKAAYSSFSAALATAYRVLKCDSAKRQVMRGLQSAYTLCEKLGLVSKSDALFKAFLVLLDLPAMPALKR